MNYSFLIEPEDLLAQLQSPAYKIIDCSLYPPCRKGAIKSEWEEFLTERIPNSIFFGIDHVAADCQLPHMLPDAKVFAKFMDWLRIGKETEIILYDYCGTWSAFRVYWMFQVFGYEKVRILAGGLSEWKEREYPIESGNISDLHRTTGTIHPFKKSLFTTSHPLLSQLNDIERELKNDSCYLIDLRSFDRFNGVVESEPRTGMPSGHIPNSINIPYSKFINKHRLISHKDIEELLEKHLGNNWKQAGKKLVFMCGTGIASCVGYAAVLDVCQWAGLSGIAVSVYDGSWYEYVQTRLSSK